jgi:transposase
MTHTLAKNLALVKPGTLFVGVDLGLDRSCAVMIDQQARQLAKFGFPHNREGYQYFRDRLEQLKERHKAPTVLVVMEPTNYLWKLVASDLERHQVPYRLVNSYTVKKRREGDQLDRSKDDARDAFTIADLARTGKYTRTQLLRGPYAELRHHGALYARLRRAIVRCTNVIRCGVGQLFPEMTQEFRSLTGLTAQAMLRNHAAAFAIRCMPVETFITGARADFRGRRLCVPKLRRVYALAATSVGLQDGVQALQLMVRQQIDTLSLLEQQRDEAYAAMSETFLSLPESRFLLSLPSLGLLTAATILGEIGNPKAYSSGRQLIKLAGTQPVPNTSGRKSRSRTPMSHKGRTRLRTALYFAVMRLIQCDDGFGKHYMRLQRRQVNPLTKMQAIGVLMNKLLRIMWALMRNETFYDPVFQDAS